jgi:hypothetical protein
MRDPLDTTGRFAQRLLKLHGGACLLEFLL